MTFTHSQQFPCSFTPGLSQTSSILPHLIENTITSTTSLFPCALPTRIGMAGSGLGNAKPTSTALLLLPFLMHTFYLPSAQDDTVGCPAPIYTPIVMPR